MILDVTGIILIPGNWGKDCPGNGEKIRNICCCDECDYFICCTTERTDDCLTCTDLYCTRAGSIGKNERTI